MNDDIEITGATVSGVCPETGKPYTIAAGDKYVCPSGAVIDSAGFSDTATGEAVDEQADTPLIVAPGTEVVMPGETPKSKRQNKDGE